MALILLVRHKGTGLMRSVENRFVQMELHQKEGLMGACRCPASSDEQSHCYVSFCILRFFIFQEALIIFKLRI